MSHIEFQLFTQEGLPLYAQIWQPSLPYRGVIGLIHGLGEHSGRYAQLATFLNQAGYVLAAYDLRGHGQSAGPRGHSPQYSSMMEDMSNFLNQMTIRYPNLPGFLYGNSLGGNLVLNYVLHHRPALHGIVVTAPALQTTFVPPVWKVKLGELLYRFWPTFPIPAGLEIDGLSRYPQIVQNYRQDPLIHGRVTARFGIDILQAGEWALAHARNFPLPLLLMHGSADRLTCVQASREFAMRVGQRCTLKIWEGCYHELHHEPEKEQIFNELLQWLYQFTVDIEQ